MDLTDAKSHGADLYWLAFLLTGCRDISIDLAAAAVSQDAENPFFDSWMRAWSRRIVISKALASICVELAESARETDLARVDRGWALPRNWSLPADTTKAEIEDALLAIAVFPRAAVVLSIFEGVHIEDAAALLNQDAALIRKAQTIGLRELTANLAAKDERVRRSRARLRLWLRPIDAM